MPIQSLHQPITLPEVDLFSFLFKRPSQRCPPGQIIYQDAENASRQYSFGEVESDAVDFGAGLMASCGIQKGDVVAIISPNDIEVPVAVLGVISIGAIATAMNPTYTKKELITQLQKSDSKLVVAHFSVSQLVKEVAQQIGIPVSRILVLGSQPKALTTFRHWKDVRKLGSVFVPPQVCPKDDVAVIQFSSGTTGVPKGVQNTHHNISSNILQQLKQEVNKDYTDVFQGFGSVPGIQDPSTDGDRICGCVPLFHIFGMSQVIMLPVYLGITALIMTKFEVEKWCQLVEKQKITVSCLVPAMLVQLIKSPSVSKFDLSSIRMLTSGASPLRNETSQTLYERHGLRIKEGYGSTEMSPLVFMGSWSKWRESVGTCGGMLPNVEVKFCKLPEDGNSETSENSKWEEIPYGQTGELFCKGPNIFPGYWKDPNATAACFDSDGWYRSGDVGHMDDHGYLHITDRAKELIKYNGLQVSPAELEGILICHEDVQDAAVVGVWSEQLATELPRAYVVPKSGLGAVRPDDHQKLMDWLAGQVVYYKKLRGGLRFVEAIPRNTNGKILRRALKAIAQKESDDSVTQQRDSKL